MGIIDDYRASHPQYKDIPDDKLEDAIYKKYYSDMPRSEFYKKIGAKDVASDIKGSQAMTGTRPVEGTKVMGIDTSKMVGNIPGGVKNLAVGTAETVYGAAKALLNPDPRAKVGYIKDLATGVWDTLKTRYKDGISKAIENDPVGVLTDVLSVVGGIHGGVRGVSRLGGVSAEEPTAAAASAQSRVASLQAKDAASGTATGVGETPMDRGGTAIANEVERLGNTSGAGRDIIEPFLRQRQAGSFDRIVGSLKQLTGNTRTARAALKETIATQHAAATPAYEAAFQAGDHIVWSPEIERLTSHSDVQEAMRQAVTSWSDEQVAQGYGAAKPGALVAGREVNDTILSHPNMAGKLVKIPGTRIPAVPNIQFWDYVKGSLDAKIESEILPNGRFSRKGRQLITIKNGLLKELDKQVPAYAEARGKWSGPASYMDALEFGNSIFRSPSEEFVSDFRELSPSDQQAVRESFISQLTAKLGKAVSDLSVGGNAEITDLTKSLNNREMVKKVLAILPDDASRQAWLTKLKTEVKSSQLTAQGLKGSQTAKRLALQEEAVSKTEDIIRATLQTAANRGSISAWIKTALDGFKKAKDIAYANRDREVAKILTGQKTSTQPRNRLSNFSSTAASGAVGVSNNQQ